MTICNYSDRLEIESGNLVRIVEAESKKKDKAMDVFKEYENGDCVCRNLYYSMYGYRVGFPEEVNSLYKNSCLTFVQKLEEYGECNHISFYSRKLTEPEKDLITRKYHDFVYVLKKWNGTIEDTFSALRIWKGHKEIEFLLAAGFDAVALNKSFWRLTEKRKKEVVLFLRKTGGKHFSLLDVQTMIKHKISVLDYEQYKSFCWKNRKVAYPVYKYLVKTGRGDINGIYLYRDYISLLVQTSHDADDPYWKWPKNLQKKHDELRDEVQRLKALEHIEMLRKKQAAYFGAVEKMLEIKLESDGYSVYVPDTVEEINEHATALHQCLVSADYVQKVIDKKCLLVFVRKGGTPIATAQINRDNTIGQFYADELDRDNCLPSDEVRKVMEKWIDVKMMTERKSGKKAEVA
ncbi:MAG: PcfJ domain-containing protein [Treponema sp.]|nr:PcfJ domain-containing protein [Treponema sp.]